MAATPATNLTIVSSGLQDARLQPSRGNPDINQFITVVRKTTRWAAQWNRVEFDGSPEFGQRVSLTIPRIAELVAGVTIAVTMPDIYGPQLAAIRAAGGTSLDLSGNFLGPLFGWTNSLGHALIQQIELEIGGVIVETIDSRLLEIYDELYETTEATLAKNRMIARAPAGFSNRTFLAPIPQTVYVPIPFWFSRPGNYSSALPLDAINAEKVRIHVTFRPINQLVYTDARVDTRTVGYRPGIDPAQGAMWPITNARFWKRSMDLSGAKVGTVYSMRASSPQTGISGELIQGVTMPPRFSPQQAYALIEYISLDEYEAITFRTAELTYHVEQHLMMPQQATQGQKEVRMEIPFANPVKELLWVAQRPEAETYNAWFLFTRDLAPVVPSYLGTQSPCSIPWWPDAQPVPTAANNWQSVPGFQTSYSEPLEGATLLYNAYDRFVHEGASYFRGLVPAQYYTKSALYNRYVYAYSFGLRGDSTTSEPTGAANWDKLGRKEFYITLNNSRLGAAPPNLNIYVYATIWNVFKVFGGRGAMLFSN